MTTPDPRDRALAHLLRRQLSAETAAADACPDAEALAAWMDGACPADEASRLEAHAATCRRCAATLAALVRATDALDTTNATDATDATGVDSDAPVVVQGTPAGGVVGGAHPASGPHGTSGTVDAAASPADVTPVRAGGRLMRWLVPATAAAAATLVWMLAPGTTDGPLLQPESQQARADEAIDAGPSARERVPEPSRMPAPLPTAPAAETVEADRATTTSGQAARGAGTVPVTPTRVPPIADAPEAARGARVPQRSDAPARVASPEDTAAALEKVAPSLPAAEPPVRLAEAAPSPPAPSPPGAATAPASAPARTTAENTAQDLAGPERFEARNRLEPRALYSADPDVRWRIVGPRTVERSTDDGVSWSRLEAGMPGSADLLDGAAPSSDVCWLAGRRGLVLRTTDGEQWQPVTSPTSADLVSIDADDATTATVRAADGAIYRTETGGQTWTRLR